MNQKCVYKVTKGLDEQTNKQTNKQKKGKKEKKKRKGVLIKCKMNNITIK